MTKKKEKVAKKKEVLAVKRDLTLESWNEDMKDNIDIVWTHRIKAEVIDVEPTYIMIFPKELPCAGLGCMIYNALERERGSNIVWRVR